MTKGNDHSRVFSTLRALLGIFWTSDRRLQAHFTSSVIPGSAKAKARDAAEQRVVRSCVECGCLSFLASEESAVGERVGRSGSVRERRDLLHNYVKGDESRRSGCRESDSAVISAR